MEKKLGCLLPGETGIISKMETEENLVKRLKDFGFVPGVEVSCRFYSPGKHLIALKCRDTMLALRRYDANTITVTMT